MKHLIVYFLFSCVSFLSAKAQDLILKKDGSELTVKLKEITAKNIIYKYVDSVNFPFYSIAKSEVFYIKYANGAKEVMNLNEADVKEKKAAINPNAIQIHGAHYYLGEDELSMAQLDQIFNKSGNANAIEAFDLAKKFKMFGYIFIGVGIPMEVTGFVLSNLHQSGDILMLPGGAFILTGFLLKGNVNRKIRSAIGFYNKSLPK